MALPQTPLMRDLAAQAFRNWMAEQESIVRDLLSRWVSEVEPTIIYEYGIGMNIKGIGVAGDPAGTVIIANPKYRPTRSLWDDLMELRLRGPSTLVGFDLARPGADRSMAVLGRRDPDGTITIEQLSEVHFNIDRLEITYDR